MHRIIVLTLALLIVSGCERDRELPSDSEVIDGPLADAFAEDPVEDGALDTDALEVFAERLVEEGPGIFRYDRTRARKTGGQERQIYVEILGLDDRQAAELSARILGSLGLTPGHSFGDENGIRLSFSMDGRDELVRVLVRTRSAHGNLLNEEATSSVYVTHPEPK